MLAVAKRQKRRMNIDIFTRKWRCLHIETYSHGNTFEKPTCFSILTNSKAI